MSEDEVQQRMARRLNTMGEDTWKTETTLADDEVLADNLQRMIGSIEQLNGQKISGDDKGCHGAKSMASSSTVTPSAKGHTDATSGKSSPVEDGSSQGSSKRQLDLSTSLNPTSNKYMHCSEAVEADDGLVPSTPLGMSPDPRVLLQAYSSGATRPRMLNLEKLHETCECDSASGGDPLHVQQDQQDQRVRHHEGHDCQPGGEPHYATKIHDGKDDERMDRRKRGVEENESSTRSHRQAERSPRAASTVDYRTLDRNGGRKRRSVSPRTSTPARPLVSHGTRVVQEQNVYARRGRERLEPEVHVHAEINLVPIGVLTVLTPKVLGATVEPSATPAGGAATGRAEEVSTASPPARLVPPTRSDEKIREEGRALGAREVEEQFRAEAAEQLMYAERQVQQVTEAKIKSEHQTQYVRAQLGSETRARLDLERNIVNRELEVKHLLDAKDKEHQRVYQQLVDEGEQRHIEKVRGLEASKKYEEEKKQLYRLE